MKFNFEIQRSILFLKKDLLEVWKPAGIMMVAIGGITLLRAHFGVYFMQQHLQSGRLLESERLIDYSSSLLMIGIPLLLIATSRAFIELGDKTRNERFLLLPVSSEEKFIVRLLTVGVLYPFAFILCYSVIVLLVGISVWLLYGLNFQQIFGTTSLVQHFKSMSGTTYEIFFLAQAIFFLGAVWFKKMHWLRTILAVIAISIAIAGLMVAIAFGFGWEYNNGYSINFNLYDAISELHPLLSILLSLCFWWLAWVRFQEVQSSDAV